MNKLQKAIETAEIPAGYTIAVTSLTTPMWIEHLTPYIQFATLLTGFIIGVLTIWLQVRKITRKDGD